MVYRFFALALLSTSVGATDFRTLNFGDLCAGVEAKEKALGSVAVPSKQMAGADIYAFQVREYDRDVFMTYFCPKGKLFTGNYSFPIERFDDAVKSYRHTYDWLVSIYGTPGLDSTTRRVETDAKHSGAGAPDPTNYGAAWQTPRASISLLIVANQPGEVNGWRILVVIGRRSP